MSVTYTRTTNVTRTGIVASVGLAALVSLACAAPAGAQAVAPPPPPSVQAIPTLGLGGVASLIVLLAGIGLLVLRRLSV